MVETRRTMLIVDDSRIDRTLLANIFKDDYSVVEAASGREAINTLHGQKIDIVVLDIFMADIDGFGVIETMRSLPEFTSIPIVVATSDPTHEELALLRGADEFITKPFNPIVVKKRVENIVTKYMLERERLQAALQETELELRSLADSVPGGICVFEFMADQRAKLSYFNDSFHELFGLTRQEMTDRYQDDGLRLIHENDRKRVADALLRQKPNERLSVEFRIVRADNRQRWISNSSVKFKDTDGNPVFRSVLMDITESKENEILAKNRAQELQYAAEHDALTGLLNRSAFCRRTAAFLGARPAVEHVLVQLDIERFKIINELYGSEKGDEVLIAIAQALTEQMSGLGTYGRMEGDHFVVCLPNDNNLIAGCIAGIEHAVGAMDIDRKVSLRYGAYPIADTAMPVDIMCDRANLALRSVKGDYNKRFALYTDEMHQAMLNEHELLEEGGQALASGQFEAFYQPIFSLQDGTLASAEALARWRHPQRGLVPPIQFIPIFESSKLIVRLDRYIREQVCRFMSDMAKRGVACPPVSVNVSRLGFYDPTLCQSLVDLVSTYNLDPSQLRIEITESAYTKDEAQLLDMMDQLHGFGFTLLMDDFGSGFSSLSMLRDVPVDIIKLDMRFLDNDSTRQKGRQILSAIVPMANSLRLPVIAEGVETAEQAEFLRSVGCTYAQGYHFARPMPQQDFSELLTAQS